MLLRGFLLQLAFLAAASAQSWSFGLAGGGSLTDAFQRIEEFHQLEYSQSKDYIAGVTVERRLGSGFSVEADALFRELHLTDAFVEPDGTLNSVSPAPVVTWEFPVLGKYRFRGGRFQPFVEAGPSFRTTGNLNAYPSHYGVSAGVGVAVPFGNFEFAPVIRYTHWVPDYNGTKTNADQLELLASISRRTHWGEQGSRFAMGLAVGTNLVSDYPVFSGRASTGLAAIPAPGGGLTIETVPATVDQSGSNSVIAGLAAEFGLPWRLDSEIDGLHHPMCVTDHKVLSTGASGTFSGCGPAWEIPLLVKRKFGAQTVRPLVEAGPSFRTPVSIGGYGVTAGVGAEIRAGALRIAPVVRFTRWAPAKAGYAPVGRNSVELVTEFLL